MTITVSQLAHAVNTRTRIVPLRVVHTTVQNEEAWLVYQVFGDCVKMLFPCRFYTSSDAVAEYCNRNDIDRQNVITEIEEE